MPAPASAAGHTNVKGEKVHKASASGLTSIKVVRRFLRRLPNGSLDASQVTSLACYKAWLASRKQDTLHPEKAFQRTLTGHLTGMDGRTPFAEDEEKAILQLVRRRQRWACFEHTKTRFGELGFRAKGHHERLRENGEHGEQSDSNQSEEQDESDLEEEESIFKPTIQGPKRMRLQKKEVSEESEDSSTTAISNVVDEDEDEDDKSDHSEQSRNDETMYGRHILDPGSPVIVSDLMKTANINYLIAATVAIANKLSSFANLWTVLYKYARMRVLGRGWIQGPSQEQVEELMRELGERYQGEYINMIDLTQDQYEHRIIAQNKISIEEFGKIAKPYGGFTGKRFLPSDTWSMLKAFATAYAFPGQDIPIRIRWLRNQGTGPLAWYDANFIAYENYHVIVEHGRQCPRAPQ